MVMITLHSIYAVQSAFAMALNLDSHAGVSVSPDVTARENLYAHDA